MKIISHSADADGLVSAYLVAKKFGITDPKDFIMLDYGCGIDFLPLISNNEEVVICDFSFENGPYDMYKLLAKTKNVTWIDHHKSSIDKYGKFGNDIPGLRIDGTAACMLTYIYYYLNDQVDINKLTQKDCEKLYDKAPDLVKYVHDNDVWRYDYGDDTEFFKLGLDALGIKGPLDPMLNTIYSDGFATGEIISNGRIIRDYRDSIAKVACKSGAFEDTILCKKGIGMNMMLGGSPWFGELIKEYDFVCSFSYNGNTKLWEYSFYSDAKRGCSCIKLAQHIDEKGGGHEHAAGCTTKNFIFKIKKNKPSRVYHSTGFFLNVTILWHWC